MVWCARQGSNQHDPQCFGAHIATVRPRRSHNAYAVQEAALPEYISNHVSYAADQLPALHISLEGVATRRRLATFALATISITWLAFVELVFVPTCTGL